MVKNRQLGKDFEGPKPSNESPSKRGKEQMASRKFGE